VSSPPIANQDPHRGQDLLVDALDCVLRFGTLMLRAGNTAFRVRQWMIALASKVGIDALAVHVALGGMTATAYSRGLRVTLATEVAPLGVNAWQIAALERLAQSAERGIAPRVVMARLDAIEAAPPLHSSVLMTAAAGTACAAFSYLNGGGILEVLASLIGGAIGQAVRLVLSRRRINLYAVTAACAVVASSSYYLISSLFAEAGMTPPQHAAGFISSVLFLVPGFPLVASLLDLLAHQTFAGISRLAYGVTLLLAAAFGVSLVSYVFGLTPQAPPPVPLSELQTVSLRAVASLAGGCAFAIIYNSNWRTALTIGCLALVGNEFRLALHDFGVALAPATFAGALTIGVLASVMHHWLEHPRISLTVSGIIIMVPGTPVFQAVLLFSQNDVLGGLRATVLGIFVVGAMALGLAVARLATAQTATES
jgi:uncharacterized membrane protein YjjP (DUF1212 family)